MPSILGHIIVIAVLAVVVVLAVRSLWKSHKSGGGCSGDCAHCKGCHYDGMIACSTLPGRAVCGLVWNIGKGKNTRYLEKALSGIPDGFPGELLEVPVGTGVLTMPVYKTLPQAEIICLDYSPDMMGTAQRRASAAGLTNVRFQQGDVGALPFAGGSFDVVLSLNGFHAFPDKEAAYREIYRVLRPGGTFCGCFYVKGENRRTDWFIEKLYTPKGFFPHPMRQRTACESGWHGNINRPRWKQ